jgi:thioredoxin-related protein
MSRTVLGGLIGALLAATAASAAGLRWEAKYDQALAQARAENKLVLLVLVSEECPWCLRLQGETLVAPRVVALGEDFVPVKVDVSLNPSLGAKFASHGVPQTVFVAPSGELVNQFTGFLPPAVFAAQMTQALRNREPAAEIPDLRKAVAERPREARSLARLGHLYVLTRQEAKALPLLKVALAQVADLDAATAAGARLDYLLAQLPTRNGETAPDLLDWLTAHPQSPRVTEARYHAGYASALKGDGQRALDLWAEVIKAAPESFYGVLATYYTGVVTQALEGRRSNGT